MKLIRCYTIGSVCLFLSLSPSVFGQGQPGGRGPGGQNSGGGGQGNTAQDPGVRASNSGVGQPLSTLTPEQVQFFNDGLARFVQIDSVSGGAPNEPGSGLGPGFNSNSCGNCHSQPASGGSSPSQNQYPFIGPNPQIQAGVDYSASNTMPFFITADGPCAKRDFHT